MVTNSNLPLVSIVSINYDHPEVTCAMLESMRKITYPNVEVIVVDNASPEDRVNPPLRTGVTCAIKSQFTCAPA